MKLDILLNWFFQISMASNFNLFQLLFGIGSIPTPFDFDIGYILQMFGFIGMAAIVRFLIKIYSTTLKEYKIVFFLFLISIGATVIINFRFSILIFIILSLYNTGNKFKNE